MKYLILSLHIKRLLQLQITHFKRPVGNHMGVTGRNGKLSIP